MKIQTGTMKLMTWFLVVVVLALMAVSCGGDAQDQTAPGLNDSPDGSVAVVPAGTNRWNYKCPPPVPTATPIYLKTPRVLPDGTIETMWIGQTEYLRYREISKRSEAIRPKYDALFKRQPNAWGVGEGLFQDEDGKYIVVPDGHGGYCNVVGFIIRVTEKVPQEELPPECRIPDVIEGIPVQIRERPLPIGGWGSIGEPTTFETANCGLKE